MSANITSLLSAMHPTSGLSCGFPPPLIFTPGSIPVPGGSPPIGSNSGGCNGVSGADPTRFGKGGAHSPTLYLQRNIFAPQMKTAKDDPIVRTAALRVPEMTDALVLHEPRIFTDPAVKAIVSGLHLLTPDQRFKRLLDHATLVRDEKENHPTSPAGGGIPILHLMGTDSIQEFSLRIYYLYRGDNPPIIVSFRNCPDSNGTDYVEDGDVPGELYLSIRRNFWPLDMDRLWDFMQEVSRLSGNLTSTTEGALYYSMGIALRLEAEAEKFGWPLARENLFDGLWEYLRRQEPA